MKPHKNWMNVISFVFLWFLLAVHGNKEIDGKASKDVNDYVPDTSNTQGKATCIILHHHLLKIRKYFPLKIYLCQFFKVLHTSKHKF